MTEHKTANEFRKKINDRIAEAYFGHLGKPMMRKTHERVNWICQHVTGTVVYDIGCSQGIVPILLGREGYRVYAIDIDSEAINRANELLQQEPEQIRSRVFFQQDDFLSFTPPEPVDTIISGEVLEHFNHPQRIIDNVAQHLKEEGAIVVTVPFGINDFFDHKKTFYIQEPLCYLSRYFDINSISILGKWIGFSGKQKRSDRAYTKTDKFEQFGILQTLEDGFYQIERELIDERDTQQQRAAELAAQLAAKDRELANIQRELLEKLEVHEKREAELATQLREKDDQLTKTQNKLFATRDDHQKTEKELRTQLGDKDRELTTLRQSDQVHKATIERLNKELTTVRQRFSRIEKNAHSSRWLLRQASDKTVHAPRDISRRLRRSLKKRLAASFHAGALDNAGTVSLADPHYRKFLSSALILCLQPALPRRIAERMRRRMEKHAAAIGRALPRMHSTSGREARSHALRRHKTRNLRQVNDEQQKLWAEKLNKPTKSIRIACILDDFSYICFSPEAEFFQISPTNVIQELEEFQPDLFFVESAWRGKDESWRRNVNHPNAALTDAIKWCQSNHIPTIFWNKEDPVHFGTFLNTACLFDSIFTTDIDCIERYKHELGHNRVYLLPFACQPAIHNPVEISKRRDAFCFAGAYYSRYPERIADLTSFIEALPSYRPIEIYDRNFGQDHPDYQFPDEYRQYIVGTLPPDKIQIAYKGYRYAINMNSIKQSQSMFARRVFELLASNTITVSNHARALRIFFGDLVIASDSGKKVVRHLEEITQLPGYEDRLRLAGLRKVMQEHTYHHRLEYILEKVTDQPRPTQLPKFSVLACVGTEEEACKVVDAFERQCGVVARLKLITVGWLSEREVGGESGKVEIIPLDQIADESLSAFADDDTDWLAAMLPGDYYGPNYLLDIALATRYCQEAAVIGKAEYFACEQGEVNRQGMGWAYRPAESLLARRAAIAKSSARVIDAREWLAGLEEWQYDSPEQFAIDAFNYCERGNTGREVTKVSQAVGDLEFDTGLPLGQVLETTDAAAIVQQDDSVGPSVEAKELAELFGAGITENLRTSLTDSGWQVVSELQDGTHAYLYAPESVSRDFLLKEYLDKNCIDCQLEATTGIDLRLVLLFFDAEGNRIDHAFVPANCNHTAKLPDEAVKIKLGLRVYGRGEALVKRLRLSHEEFFHSAIIGTGQHLVLTNHYPSYDDIYRNGFVHSRVAGYRKYGVNVDVFRLRPSEPLSFHEFEGIDVITGTEDALRSLLGSTRYQSILVHFLDAETWNALYDFVDRIKVFVWIHGSEIQPWWRREFNLLSKKDRRRSQKASDGRMNFWKNLFSNLPENIHFVFVSNYFAEEVMQDYGIQIPNRQYSIIHNPIDQDIFRYTSKDASQRRKILSICSYASRKYANDLTVAAIQSLQDKPFFNDLEFRLIGDGQLFEETLAPLRGLQNVKIERRFLTQPEIAELHKQYGIFLCPTRWDSHGVSRDEAMSSGLVPVTNAMAAVPEFVDESCGFMAPPEEAAGLAAAIQALYLDPDRFLAMSNAAAARVRRQSAAEQVINKELELITSSGAFEFDI